MQKMKGTKTPELIFNILLLGNQIMGVFQKTRPQLTQDVHNGLKESHLVKVKK